MIIGVTGPIGSGTDSLGMLLQERGFKRYSYSDELREDMKKLGIELTRENLIEYANRIRKEKGTGILSKRIIARMQKGKNYVVGNIRNPGEVEVMRDAKDFVLVKIDASQEVRFGRMKERQRESDPITWEEFLKLEERDLGKKEEEHGQQHWKVFEMADHEIENNGTEEEFRERVERFLVELENKNV